MVVRWTKVRVALNIPSIPGQVQVNGRLAFGQSISYAYVKQKSLDLLKLLREKYRIVGATIAVVLVAGTGYYMTEAQKVSGTVVAATQTTMTVQYDGNKTVDVVLPMARIPGRIGEKVEVHLTKVSGVIGISRDSNGDLAVPVGQ